MKNFKDIDDVEEWLEPMDYQGFWYAMTPYNLSLQPREYCDAEIARGEDAILMLNVLKGIARHELTIRHGLEWRMATPWVQLVKSH